MLCKSTVDAHVLEGCLAQCLSFDAEKETNIQKERKEGEHTIKYATLPQIVRETRGAKPKINASPNDSIDSL